MSQLLDLKGEEINPNRWCVVKSYNNLTLGFITHFSNHSVILRIEHGWKRQVGKHITHLDMYLISEDDAREIIKNDRTFKYDELKTYPS